MEELITSLRKQLDNILAMQRRLSSQPKPFIDGGKSLLQPLKEAKAWAEQNLKPGVLKPFQPIEEIVRKWEDGNWDLTLRDINHLCWHPPTGTDSQFWDFLVSKKITFTARRLQGLVYSYHSRFKELRSALQKSLSRALWDALKAYKGRNRAVTAWQAHMDLILGAVAPHRLGQEILQNLQPIEEKTAALLISGNTSFVKEAVAVAIEIALAAWPQPTQDQRVYLYENLLSKADIHTKRQAVERLIIKAGGTAGDQLVNEVKNYVLGEKDLGDPRLPINNPNWVGLDEAKDILIQWLSLADITFFFELVITDYEDVHRRKAFWLNYVDQIKRSWVILNDRDFYRLRLRQRELQRNLGDATIGRFRWASTSAFILDFGSIVIVEFSQPGNAAYVYHSQEASKFIQFWKKYLNYHSELKDSNRTCRCLIAGQPSTNKGRIIHQGDWEYRARQMMAYHGIRRKVEKFGR